MSDFFFFTDLEALSVPQTQEQAFGPVPGDELSFRVNNQFYVKENASAIAVVDAIPLQVYTIFYLVTNLSSLTLLIRLF